MERLSHHPEVEPELRRETTDLSAYLAGFIDSPQYLDGFKRFYYGKELSDDVTFDEMSEVYVQYPEASFALLDYARNADVLIFDADYEDYSDEEKDAISEYFKSVEAMKHYDSQEDLRELDRLRTSAHNNLARTLVRAGKVPSTTLGLVVGRLFLVGEGIESYESIAHLLNNMDQRGR